MDDSFHEMIVKGQRPQYAVLQMIGLFLASLVLIVVLIYFGSVLGMLLPLMIVGVGYGLFYLLRGYSREFEYTMTNGEIDIDLIIAQRKRKRVFSGAARNFESMAPVAGSKPAAAGKTAGSTPVIDCRGLSSNAKHYEIRSEFKGRRVVVLFTPDEIILNQLKRFNPARITIG
jgi:hypothetical protein